MKPSDPPHEKRFDYEGVALKRAQTSSFAKTTKRKELFKLGLQIDSYDRNEETGKRKLGLLVPNFKKTCPRESLVLKHRTLNQRETKLEDLDSAFNKQSHVRGATKCPKFDSLKPRDDAMYRVTDGYAFNVPKRQSAASTPKFMASSLTKFSMGKFNSTFLRLT